MARAKVGAQPPRGVKLETIQELSAFATFIASSDIVPKDFRNKPANCFVAIQHGAEVGLGPIQAIQNTAVINGRPSLYGDIVLGLCKSKLDWVEADFLEFKTGTPMTDEWTATCQCRHVGATQPVVRTFSIADAKRAGLWGKAGPWTQYPTRMLQMRARAFALRDTFPHHLKGIRVAEELMGVDELLDQIDLEPKTRTEALAGKLANAGPPAAPDERAPGTDTTNPKITAEAARAAISDPLFTSPAPASVASTGVAAPRKPAGSPSTPSPAPPAPVNTVSAADAGGVSHSPESTTPPPAPPAVPAPVPPPVESSESAELDRHLRTPDEIRTMIRGKMEKFLPSTSYAHVLEEAGFATPAAVTNSTDVTALLRLEQVVEHEVMIHEARQVIITDILTDLAALGETGNLVLSNVGFLGENDLKACTDNDKLKAAAAHIRKARTGR